ncbi:hypothetical protein J2T56_001933 [Natronobacillus azotifigens]|uniref:Sporulation protein Cse60 n=1 Tax=Natronobacillus azotifigens TaxID=472978 RepID=A0A9J6REX8_9BACI|nr:hypothetical protein [Natronobacillus azotifigens]MCZ0703729.1 hypothetical protein [Natronobacillus azotifigens]
MKTKAKVISGSIDGDDLENKINFFLENEKNIEIQHMQFANNSIAEVATTVIIYKKTDEESDNTKHCE